MYIEFTVGDTIGGKRGSIDYDEESKTIEVTFPNKDIKAQVLKYFNTKREYRIPESDEIDDFRVDRLKPLESVMYMELALMTMYVATDIKPDWNTQKGGT